MTETYTITATPGQWRFINAYQGHDLTASGRERFGVVLTDASLLPEEVANEVRTSRNGNVYLSSFRPPVVEHFAGWEALEQDLRRMAATNRRPDDLFEGQTLQITFFLALIPPRPGSSYTTPLVTLPVTLIRIVEPADDDR